jgi:hypothetical protein
MEQVEERPHATKKTPSGHTRQDRAARAVTKSVGSSLIRTIFFITFGVLFIFLSNVFVVIWLVCSADGMHPQVSAARTLHSKKT